MSPASFDVRVWKVETSERRTKTSYKVRWVVEGRLRTRTFGNASLAESFRAELLAAARKGEAFDTDSGLPLSQVHTGKDARWYDFACEYVDMKWKRASANYRKSIAEALMTATVALLPARRGRPREKAIRSALLQWAFNTNQRAHCPPGVAEVLLWVQGHSGSVSALAEPRTIRATLDALASKLDGTPAAPTVTNRKRAVLSNALSYAVEIGLLAGNPIGSITWRAPKATHAIDRRSVVNPVQARTLLAAVGSLQRSGPRFVAFFGVMYYAALRPEEAVNLRGRDLTLPEDGWGEIHLHEATPHTGKAWTDSGEIHDRRQLKHRARGESRTVPCSPELVRLLREHLGKFGTDEEGRVFTGERGGPVPTITYERVWHRARKAALTPEVCASPLARRPYDLRHAAVSTWLNSGVPATEVAEWAGHSVAVLLDVYAKCLEGGRQGALRRLDQARAGSGDMWPLAPFGPASPDEP